MWLNSVAGSKILRAISCYTCTTLGIPFSTTRKWFYFIQRFPSARESVSSAAGPLCPGMVLSLIRGTGSSPMKCYNYWSMYGKKVCVYLFCSRPCMNWQIFVRTTSVSVQGCPIAMPSGKSDLVNSTCYTSTASILLFPDTVLFSKLKLWQI